MKTDVTCSRCGQHSVTFRIIAGRRIRCRTCGSVQRIPRVDTAQDAAPGTYQLAPAEGILTAGCSLPFEPNHPAPTDSQHANHSRFPWLESLRPWIFETSQVQGIGTCLIVLSAADLLMTFVLLRKSELFFESNPIAQWFFQKWNMTGMVGFKFSMIAGVILLSEIIERKRPGWGRFVLLVGCIGAAYAVFTGGRLYMIPEVAVNIERD